MKAIQLILTSISTSNLGKEQSKVATKGSARYPVKFVVMETYCRKCRRAPRFQNETLANLSHHKETQQQVFKMIIELSKKT